MASEGTDIERIAICQHPAGEGVWWRLAGDETGERCVQDCDCAPRVYVSVDAVPPSLQEVRERLEDAIEGERELRDAGTRANDRDAVLIHGAAFSALADLRSAFPNQTQPDSQEGR